MELTSKEINAASVGVTINLKPLSVNDAWRGRRFASPAYKTYAESLKWLLPKIHLPEPPFEVHYEFGFSSGGSDLDNPVKPLQDCLQKKYGFNDNDIGKMVVTKKPVKKGKEYLHFKIFTYVEEVIEK